MTFSYVECIGAAYTGQIEGNEYGIDTEGFAVFENWMLSTESFVFLFHSIG